MRSFELHVGILSIAWLSAFLVGAVALSCDTVQNADDRGLVDERVRWNRFGDGEWLSLSGWTASSG